MLTGGDCRLIFQGKPLRLQQEGVTNLGLGTSAGIGE